MKSGNLPAHSAGIESALLEQVTTFGMTTRMVWSRAPNLKAFEPADIASVIRTLVWRKMLETHPLHHGRFYFSLTKQAAAALPNSCTQGGPYSEREKYFVLARLLIATSGEFGAIPLSEAKLRAIMPNSVGGIRNQFVVDSEKQQLRFLRMDTAIRALPNRMAQHLRQDVFRFVKIPAIASLIKAQQFELVLVTCTERRSAAIVDQFRLYDRVGIAPIRSIVLSELLPLVTSVPIGGAINAN